MDHELLEQKGDFFAERDDTYSNIKHEFSRIFHENNLHSFANASDIGFLDFGKLTGQGYSGDYEDLHSLGEMDMIAGRPYHKEEVNPYMGVNMHNSYSPMRFLQPNLGSNVNFNPGFSNMASAVQKQQPMQEPNLFQSYQPYKYADYSYLDYAAQPTANHLFTPNMYDIYNPPDMMDAHPNNPLSLMWSNEAPKSAHKKSFSTDDLLTTSQTVAAMKKFGSVPSETNQKKSIPFKIEQDFEKVSNKTISQQFDRVAKGQSQPDSAGIGPRRTNRVTKPLYNTTTLINEEEESGSDDDKDESFGDAKNRSSRGLRVLSLKVRDIVSKKKKTSYKEVAEALLQDLSQKLKGKSQAEISKEEQNVKRRVYDALNVLIAADILRKEGKLVCCEGPVGNLGQNKKKAKGDKGSLLEQIQELKRRKKEKVEALQELVFKSLAIRNLVRRNKEKLEKEMAEKNPVMYNTKNKKGAANTANGAYVNATRIDVVQENATIKQKTQDVISFPFIVLLSSSPENSMNLNMDTSQKQLSIESKKPFNIFGDIDVLLKMRLHYVSRDIFEKEVPKELQKYVSQSFTDALK